jgi:hypothetical protein
MRYGCGASTSFPSMGTILIKAKTRTELSVEYGISLKPLKRWFKREKLNIPNGLIDPFHPRIIYETFGVPQNMKIA